jgi:FkbM family methyltransferase
VSESVRAAPPDLWKHVMATLDSAKERARRVLVQSMRACVAHDRLPWSAKNLYVTGCQRLLPALGIESDETPLESEYGTKFVAGPGSSYLNSILRFRGVHEPVLSEFILRHVHDGDVCVDAGANCGYFSLLLAQRVAPSGKVIAIEAAPDSVRRLRANLELNGAAGIVDVVMAACAQQKGEITFYLHPHNDCWARLSPPAKGELDRRYMGKTWIPMTVAADTLASIVGGDAERVSFIKLDIEGAEAAVTPEIAATFPHPRLVVALEAKAPHIEATLKPFERRGFYVYDLHNDYRWIFERNVPAITEAAYGDFNNHSMADVVLSRQPLTLS